MGPLAHFFGMYKAYTQYAPLKITIARRHAPHLEKDLPFLPAKI
jgi:hypothetical protein